jgi:hypothetical protein
VDDWEPERCGVQIGSQITGRFDQVPALRLTISYSPTGPLFRFQNDKSVGVQSQPSTKVGLVFGPNFELKGGRGEKTQEHGQPGVRSAGLFVCAFGRKPGGPNVRTASGSRRGSRVAVPGTARTEGSLAGRPRGNVPSPVGMAHSEPRVTGRSESSPHRSPRSLRLRSQEPRRSGVDARAQGKTTNGNFGSGRPDRTAVGPVDRALPRMEIRRVLAPSFSTLRGPAGVLHRRDPRAAIGVQRNVAHAAGKRSPLPGVER